MFVEQAISLHLLLQNSLSLLNLRPYCKDFEMSLLEHLALVASIRPGETLALGRDPNKLPRVSSKSSPLTAVCRYWEGESWPKTFQYVESVFVTALRQKKLTPRVREALPGLRALLSTYSAKREATVALSRLLGRVEEALDAADGLEQKFGSFSCCEPAPLPDAGDFALEPEPESAALSKTDSKFYQAARLAYDRCRPYFGPAQQAARVAAIVACFL